MSCVYNYIPPKRLKQYSWLTAPAVEDEHQNPFEIYTGKTILFHHYTINDERSSVKGKARGNFENITKRSRSEAEFIEKEADLRSGEGSGYDGDDEFDFVPYDLEQPKLRDDDNEITMLDQQLVYYGTIQTRHPKIKRDLYQKRPLLSSTENKDKSQNNFSSSETEKEYKKNKDRKRDETHAHIINELSGTPEDEVKYPKEKWKTLLSAVIMFLSFILTLASLSLVHERVPDREIYGPLPDVILDNVPALDWALNVSEYIILFCINSAVIILFFHKHRYIVFRRMFLIMSIFYIYRAITMYVTVLPIASKTYPCSPKSNDTSIHLIAKRIVKLMSGFGLAIYGKHTYCGDFIYSGHTVILVFTYLLIAEYTPRKLWLVHWMYWILGCIGIIMLGLSHGHYSVDVIIAYFITTRIFWTYHTLANNASLKEFSTCNLLSREWWFAIFLYFEGNVADELPREYEWPFSWPTEWYKSS